jgi:hypothetical protein
VIRLRRSDQRRHDRPDEPSAWQTFDPTNRDDPLADGFGILESFNEHLLAPGGRVPRLPRCDAEILTYVHQGTLAQEDSEGRSGVIQAGEFQRITAQRSVRHHETNASLTDNAHVFQICLRPSETGLTQSYEQRRFSAAERRGAWRLIASPDGQIHSLRVHPDASLHSALLDPGQHVVRELTDGRMGWLHVVSGEIVLGDAVLTGGDGAGMTEERAVSLTARTESELLLVDLDARPSRRSQAIPRA